jgi:acyl-CoA thioesterase II
MPDCAPPEELGDDNERWAKMRAAVEDKSANPVIVNRPSLRPIEMRSVIPIDYLNPSKSAPEQLVWIRASGSLKDLGVADDAGLQRAILAYASDFNLMGTSLLPHAVSILNQKLQPASLDHCIWFHDDFAVDDWLLYSMDSPRSSHGRGLSRGSFYTRDGRLVASTIQEGLIRLHTD